MSQSNNELYDFRSTRLYELLLHLKPRQKDKILLIVELEYAKKKENYILLLKRIINHIKNTPQKHLRKNELFENTVVSKQKRNHIVSELFKKICKILSLLNLLKDYEQEHFQTLTDFFINANLDINVKYALGDFKNSLNKKTKRTHDFHYRQMKYNEFYVIQNRSSRRYSSNFKAMNDSLDAFYAESKLRFLCFII